jgi:hypothetical protein
MSTVDPEFSRVRHFDREKDFSVLAKDESHVRICKLFPMCSGDTIPITDYRRFHLRFYIPRDVFDDKFKKIDKLFILFNGLDEVDHFTLYDQLGQGLAKFNYASVLLPLPNHLNRNPGFRFNDDNKMEKPSDAFLAERDKVFDIYLQLLKELRILIEHVRGNCRHTKAHASCRFYDHFFEKDVSVSLLGYSMGGLAALCAFLVNKDLLNTCIMLNSGAKLDDIDVGDFIPIDQWKEMVAGIQKDWEIPVTNTEEARLFDRVFLGNKNSLLKRDLREVSRRVCFVLGGSDNVTKYKSIMNIEPDDHGVATLKLPGINHFLSLDMQWNKWFRLVINTIAQFDDGANREVLTRNQIIEEFMYFQKKYNVFGGPKTVRLENISDENDRMHFFRVLYAAEGTYKNVETAVIEMFIAIDRMINRPKLFPEIKDYPIRDLFGQRAFTKFKIDRKVISDLLRKQKAYAERGEIIPTVGELLVSTGALDADRIRLLAES